MPSPPWDPSQPQRICITLNNSAEDGTVELPFVVGVLADFTGMPERPLPNPRRRRFVNVEVSNFDRVMVACSPHLAFKVTNRLSDDGWLSIDLKFRELKDFAPEGVAKQIKPLQELLKLRDRLASLHTSLATNDAAREMLRDTLGDIEKRDLLRAEISQDQVDVRGSSPDRVVDRTSTPTSAGQYTRPSQITERGVWSKSANTQETSLLDQLADSFHETTPTKREARKDIVAEFVKQVLGNEMSYGPDVEALISSRIAQINQLVSTQLGEIFHQHEFMKLESTWRGLHFLIRSARKAKNVQIRILNISKRELFKQFTDARVLYSSVVSRKVLAEAADTPGANPFGLLISDFSISAGSEDLLIMQRMAKMGAAAHVPFIASADATLCGLSGFTELAEASQLTRLFSSDSYAGYHVLRARPESRYIGLVLPQVLLRQPYRDIYTIEHFTFDERVEGDDRTRFLWGSAVWAFAAHQAAGFDRYGWFGAARAADDPGEITDLPRFDFQTDDGDIGFVGPVETTVSDAVYLELRDLGLIPICQLGKTNRVAFFENWSLHRPKVDPDAEEVTTYESAEIDCVLCVSRIAHYVRRILQSERQRFSNAQECEEHLRQWIAPYVAPEYAQGTRLESAFPLSNAQFRIALSNAPSHPGLLRAFLSPRRAVGIPPHPIEINIPIVLPWYLTLAQETPHNAQESTGASRTLVGEHRSDLLTGREQFIHRMLAAEECMANSKYDAALIILEDLAEQIDRYHLCEWESPQLIIGFCDLLRRCYLLSSRSEGAVERSTRLLQKIRRLNPSHVIE